MTLPTASTNLPVPTPLNITLRLVKGSPLTFQEMDNNFTTFKSSIENLINAINLQSNSNAFGFMRLSPYFMMQWGHYTSKTGYKDYVSFPITFPTTCMQVIITSITAELWGTGTNPATPYITYTGSTNYISKSGFYSFTVKFNERSSPVITYASGLESAYLALGY